MRKCVLHKGEVQMETARKKKIVVRFNGRIWNRRASRALLNFGFLLRKLTGNVLLLAILFIPAVILYFCKRDWIF